MSRQVFGRANKLRSVYRGPVFHRKEQWDLECWPWLCVHWEGSDFSKRIFCLWGGGVQIANWLWRWTPKGAPKP